jgi:hypothetical protein
VQCLDRELKEEGTEMKEVAGRTHRTDMKNENAETI